jgi:hypothetical protein
VLRDAGLVRVRQDAQPRWYELEPGPLTDIEEWLRPYRKFWAGRPDALERRLPRKTDGRLAPEVANPLRLSSLHGKLPVGLLKGTQS